MVQIRNILLPTDLSEFSLAALEYGSSFAVLYGASLTLLHVTDVTPPVLPLHGAEPHDDVYRARAEEDAAQQLRLFVERNVPPEIRLTPIVRVGEPADEIRRFAEAGRMDLVVMATHGRTGLEHIVMGSVAERVVRLCTVPVLTVKPARFRDSIIRNEDIERQLHLRTRT
jgi:nucleotide-binding universal stress UspA family protein